MSTVNINMDSNGNVPFVGIVRSMPYDSTPLGSESGGGEDKNACVHKDMTDTEVTELIHSIFAQ